MAYSSRSSGVVFVAGSGGHLAQLNILARRIRPESKRIWVSDKSDQSESLLADRDYVLVSRVVPRNILTLLIAATELWPVIRRSHSAVYSTGAGVALSAWLVCLIKRVNFVYIESATRVTELSLTGKILNRLPACRRLVQHLPLVNQKWEYMGSVLEGFEVLLPEDHASNSEDLTDLAIFGTVGANRSIGFDRLIAKLEQLRLPQWSIYWQYGPSSLPSGVQGSATLPYSEMTARAQSADVVISHAGTGSILMALEHGKMPVVVARSGRGGEHVDEHQTDLATLTAQRGLTISRTVESLELADIAMAHRASVRRSEELDAFPI